MNTVQSNMAEIAELRYLIGQQEIAMTAMSVVIVLMIIFTAVMARAIALNNERISFTFDMAALNKFDIKRMKK